MPSAGGTGVCTTTKLLGQVNGEGLRGQVPEKYRMTGYVYMEREGDTVRDASQNSFLEVAGLVEEMKR